MIAKNKKIYVGTLYVGENELEACKQSVKNQTVSNITHEIFSHLPNKEAHDTLYNRIMELQNEYDYFIKLDADMVLKRDTIIEELVDIFETEQNLDHAVFSVDDWYSNTQIMGMHMFSNRVKWDIRKDGLFVDPNPIIKGNRIMCWDTPAPVADHSPNPSISEAYMFGYHRALKIVQRNRVHKITNAAKFQLELLQSAWQCLIKDQNIIHAAVIEGANRVFSSNQKVLDRKILNEDDVSQMLDDVSIEEFIKLNRKKWDKKSFGYKLRYFRYCKLSDIIYSVPISEKFKNLIKKIIKYK